MFNFILSILILILIVLTTKYLEDNFIAEDKIGTLWWIAGTINGSIITKLLL